VESRPSEATRGTLYVVATPIGNLGDITLRALEVLKSVPLVAAEDTRLTRRLWARHGITTRLISYHAQSAPRRRAELLDHLTSGADLALVTDAGTPLVSDPGAELVGEWLARGGLGLPIPGPSAVLAALVAAGLPAARFAFEGFLPRRGRERRERLAAICADAHTTVMFEAPGRVGATLAELASACGPARAAAVCRELTKLHEQVWRGTLGDLAARALAEPVRGEVTIVVAGAAPGGGENVAHVEAARVEVDRLVAAGLSRSSAAREVAARTGLPRRELFRSEAPGDEPGDED
jgi:16S rRNA (cytidine1402-2'-O)-methyltransferase